ncbi:hypothetical protein CATMQ487_19160 [Sphaerotilus microaerophilus]|uniref:Methanolan biosynthesis EpsI domain-containing protein n=2 Tax=Sphaerotilus microaerophilus TaxID=2914710 RepID=A0ABM7YKT8_9BURK|nr:hypothetical protein CATMQ487_19160 [Sphaerotilus sp. FB-5]
MLVCALGAQHLKPGRFLADQRSAAKIEDRLPREFAGWKIAPVAGVLVNPQQDKLINSLYAEVINRTYVSSSGQRLMLSISYGRNQSDNLQVHKPEVCYPAQGFQVQSLNQGELRIDDQVIPVRRLETTFGPARPEPVTYWTTVGDHAVASGTDKKLQEMRYAFKGFVADGLLFRMSSIDPDSKRAFETHSRFAADLYAALGPAERRQLFGSLD